MSFSFEKLHEMTEEEIKDVVKDYDEAIDKWHENETGADHLIMYRGWYIGEMVKRTLKVGDKIQCRDDWHHSIGEISEMTDKGYAKLTDDHLVWSLLPARIITDEIGYDRIEIISEGRFQELKNKLA